MAHLPPSASYIERKEMRIEVVESTKTHTVIRVEHLQLKLLKCYHEFVLNAF